MEVRHNGAPSEPVVITSGNVRCKSCGKKMAEALIGVLVFICERCKNLNVLDTR